MELCSFPSGATVIDFEQFPDSQILTNKISGLIFSNTIVLTAGVSLNEFEFPPHSGMNVASDNNGPMSIFFSTPINSFSGYLTYSVPLTVTAFDQGNNQLTTLTSMFSNNEALSGDLGSSPNEFIHVASALGISSLTITGDLGGSSFVLDDAVFSTTGVPEPNTLILFMAGSLGLIGFRKLMS